MEYSSLGSAPGWKRPDGKPWMETVRMETIRMENSPYQSACSQRKRYVRGPIVAYVYCDTHQSVVCRKQYDRVQLHQAQTSSRMRPDSVAARLSPAVAS